jgi:dihydrodipicolinate synthase/N-acetylneuraminate lyase
LYPAAVTPFTESGEIDYVSLLKLLSWFKANESTGVVLAGTNGEGPSLSAVEKRDLVREAVRLTDLPIILGIATPSLEEAVWLSEQARKSGAVGVLVMPPAYFREVPEVNIQLWFEALARRTSAPIFLYNFPNRTGITLSADLVAELAKVDNIVGLKDSSGERGNLESYRQAFPSGSLFVGDERLIPEALAQGWSGSISGAANVLPLWLSRAAQPGGSAASALIPNILDQVRASGQPMAHKAILKSLGVIGSDAVRLPLTQSAFPAELALAISKLQA